MNFDPTRRLVMATFRTVLGHNLPAGTPLAIVEQPLARGEVDEAMAERLYNGRIAAYADDHRPTPVETPEQERSRLAVEALRDARDGEAVFMQDLLVWPVDDEATGKSAGQKVTKEDLQAIADRENVAFEPGDNKADLIRKIVNRRAAAAGEISTYSQSTVGLDTTLGTTTGASEPETGAGAHTGATGDAHGPAGEGPTD